MKHMTKNELIAEVVRLAEGDGSMQGVADIPAITNLLTGYLRPRPDEMYQGRIMHSIDTADHGSGTDPIIVRRVLTYRGPSSWVNQVLDMSMHGVYNVDGDMSITEESVETVPVETVPSQADQHTTDYFDNVPMKSTVIAGIYQHPSDRLYYFIDETDQFEGCSYPTAQAADMGRRQYFARL